MFLVLPGLLTSAFYFGVRDLYATIIFHDFQAMYGVMASMNTIGSLFQASYPIITLSIVSILVLVTLDLFIVRRANKVLSHG